MAKPKLKDEQILGFLSTPTRRSQSRSGGDPTMPTRIKVTLDELQPYDLNPRRSDNPKFDEIRDSIEVCGLKNPPTITRRHPDDDKYSIREGGNTRLKALWELYRKYLALAEEADDPEQRRQFLARADEFYRHELLFIPFTDDVQALSDHMVENEIRGGTKFIERALVVDKYINLFKEEDEAAAKAAGKDYKYRPLSSRKLAERISSYGWVVRHDDVLRYQYAVTLLEHIPTALWAGAGNKVIRQINSLNKAYRSLWSANTDRSTDELDSLFYSTLSECDAESIELDLFSNRLNRLLAPIFDTSESVIAMEIASITDSRKKASKLTPTNNEADSGADDENKNASTGSSTRPKRTKAVNTATNIMDEMREAVDSLVSQVGNIGLEMLSDPDQEGGVLFHNLAVFDHPDDYPRPDRAGDTERAAAWWSMLKASRVAFAPVCSNGSMQWDRLVSGYLTHFMKHHGNSLALTILWIEDQLSLNPELYEACQRVLNLAAQYARQQQSME